MEDSGIIIWTEVYTSTMEIGTRDTFLRLDVSEASFKEIRMVVGDEYQDDAGVAFSALWAYSSQSFPCPVA